MGLLNLRRTQVYASLDDVPHTFVDRPTRVRRNGLLRRVFLLKPAFEVTATKRVHATTCARCEVERRRRARKRGKR